ncbi:hypothetical protein STEG23_022398 [Scotinomys teguina]
MSGVSRRNIRLLPCTQGSQTNWAQGKELDPQLAGSEVVLDLRRTSDALMAEEFDQDSNAENIQDLKIQDSQCLRLTRPAGLVIRGVVEEAPLKSQWGRERNGTMRID